MTKPEATDQLHVIASGLATRIRAPSPRWIGFSEDDGSVDSPKALDIRRQRRGFLQRVEDNAFHLCASYVG